MAVMAALLAVATLMGHRHPHRGDRAANQGHRRLGVLPGQERPLPHVHRGRKTRGAEADRRAPPSPRNGAKRPRKRSADSDGIRVENEKLDEETHATARRATFFDASEICLEIAIVLCSISLLTGSQLFWKISFLGAGAWRGDSRLSDSCGEARRLTDSPFSGPHLLGLPEGHPVRLGAEEGDDSAADEHER